MLVVETIAKIRRYHFVEGRPIKQISRDLNISRNTVRKVIRSQVTEHRYEREDQQYPRLRSFTKRLDELLEENLNRPKRRRMTAQRMFEILQGEGYKGAYDSVQRYAKKWREERGREPEQCYIPLRFEPGDAYQFDWSHEKAIIGGVPQTIKVAHFRLCHSRMFFVAAYPRESQEMVFDAHNKAFAFFQGTCRRGIYDNLKTAVNKILRGKERQFNRKFEQLCSHYLVEPVACTPGAGWEKGQVENQVGNIRKWLFAARPRFSSFAELNQWLHDQCTNICRKRRHPENKTKSVWEVFEEERVSLIPVSSEFQGYSETECRVSSTCLVRYDRNHYSVESKLAGKTATVRASAARIKVISNGRVIADHPRQFGRDNVVYDPWHYISVLQRKPGALRNGAPFKEWDLPVSLSRVRSRLSRHPGGDREFVDILLAVQRYGMDIVERACRKVLSEGTVRGEVVLNVIARHCDPLPVDTASVPDSLVVTIEPTADCSRYDALLQEVVHGTP
jgi:transposase